MIEPGAYEAQRPYLFAIAYRMLGRASEAEDVLQDAWLRAAEAGDEVREPRPWLATVVTRLCLDRLKSAQARREQYVGEWLPEPVPTGDVLTPEETAERHDSVSFAFLVLLEHLSPAERAAFLLREVFAYDYREVAAILGSSEPACRQLVHRARTRLEERRPRFPPSPGKQDELVDGFLAAARDGNLGALERLLARDARFVSDGGGKVAAVRKVLVGAREVATVVAGFGRQLAEGRVAAAVRFARTEVNGAPALLIYEDERLRTVMVFAFDGDRIAAVEAVRNPEKLVWLARRLERSAPT